jgi:hypothetical protein
VRRRTLLVVRELIELACSDSNQGHGDIDNKAQLGIVVGS